MNTLDSLAQETPGGFGGVNRLNRNVESGSEELKQFVTGSIISGQNSDYEIERITKYQLYWNFYEGKHWRMHNDTFISFNYVKAFIDKVNIFLLGKTAFSLQVKSLYSDIVDNTIEKPLEELINSFWKRNNKVVHTYELLQMGSICGDVWALVTWNDDKKYPEFRVLDSRQCFPEFENGDITKMTSFVLRIPLIKNDKGYKLQVYRYTEKSIETWFQKDTARYDPLDKNISSALYDKTTTKNTYETIPVVHIKNKPKASGYFSTSDAQDILKINKVYNELAQEVKNIIDYYATPTTIVTGATIKNLRRGLGNIWSGLPPEANVFNLGLDVDLSNTMNYMDRLKTAMHELTDVPEASLGKQQAISNTSAAALQLQYQPLLQQADMKWLTYGEGLTEIHALVIKMYMKFDSKNPRLSEIDKAIKKADKNHTIDDYRVEPIFSYGFPQDRMQDLMQAQYELTLQIGSRKEIMERMGKNNIPDLMQEIDDDAERANKFQLELQQGISDLNVQAQESMQKSQNSSQA